MNRWAAFFLCAAVVALALRLPSLGNRPMHNDEAVNAIKFGALWERGEYRYDPHEYHGPTLHYLTAALGKATAAPEFERISEVRLRLPTALAGIALILLLPLIRDAVGLEALVASACFTALSPMMVFYSRYWIHEMLLVLFSFFAIACVWRFWRKPSWVWAILAGLALGLMHATKETFVLALAAAVGALLINWAWRHMSGSPVKMPRWKIGWIVVAIAVWLAVWVTLFSSFFENPAGPLDSILTYQPWISNAGGDSIHAHEWSFYFQRLFWFHPSGGALWTEGLLLALAIVGAASGFRRSSVECPNGDFVRFLAGYTILLAGVYSIIPYKTPWCALGFMHGIILLAGVGVAVLWRKCTTLPSRMAMVVILGLGCTHLGWQAWRGSFPLCADRSNPWVYAQTSHDLMNLAEKVNAVAAAGQGDATLIKVIGEEGDYWPLPWYLRAYKQVGWWGEIPEEPGAPIVIASASLDAKLDQDKSRVMVGYFQLRPQVFLELYVELSLWERYLASRPHSPE